MKSKNNNGIACLMMGLGLGLVAGMLLAPRRGHQTRDQWLGGAAAKLNQLAGEAPKLRGESHRWLEIIRSRFWSRSNGTMEPAKSE